MTDIERHLSQTAPTEPRRPLSSTFTVDTYIQARQTHVRTSRLSWLASHLQGAFHMRNLTKPAALGLGLAALTLTAGTALAAALWLQPQVSVSPESITTLANGNKRFWVNIDSCQGQSQTQPEKSYYEISAKSDLTPERLAKAIEASCESQLLPELFPEIQAASKTFAEFKPGDKQYFTPMNVTFKGADQKTITLKAMLNGQTYENVTLPLSSDLRIYEKGKKIALKDLKAGDTLTLVVSTSALNVPYSTETMPLEELAKLSKDGFPIGSVVDGAIKMQLNGTSVMQAQQTMGHDWTRLVPDKNSPDGWRQLIPFDHNFKQE